MPSGTFFASAVIAKLHYSDTFTRTHASSWGSDYTVEYLDGVMSVDGSAGRLTAQGYLDAEITGSAGVDAGWLQFDLYIPADTTDTGPYFAIRASTGDKYLWASGGAQGDGDWEVGLSPVASSTPFVFTPDPSSWYTVKAFWSGYRGGAVGIKAWKVGSAEPAYTLGTHPDTGDVFDAVPYLSFEAPDVEQAGFDNFLVYSYGAPINPTITGSFTGNAVRRKTGLSGSFTQNAVIGPRNFTADAWILGGRQKHHRQFDHYGTILDTSVVLSSAIGQYAAGTDVHTVLASMAARLAAIENGTLKTRTFTADAYFPEHFHGDAVLFKTVSDTFTMDAYFGRAGSFTADAFIFGVFARTFTANAYLVQSVDGTWTWAYATPNPADGTSTVFTIPPYKQGTVVVYVDGVPQTPGVDYTETDDTIGTITFTSPPSLGAIVRVNFIACGG